MFWLWVISAVFLAVSLPYVRFFIKRIILCVKLKRVCKRQGYKLTGKRPFWFLGNRGGKNADLGIETDKALFSIKLFGPVRKNTKLIIKENGDYVIRKYYAFLSSRSQALLFSDSNPKPFGKYDFGCGYHQNGVACIILQHPAAVEVRHQPTNGNENIISDGDALCGADIYSLKGFIKKLKYN